MCTSLLDNFHDKAKPAHERPTAQYTLFLTFPFMKKLILSLLLLSSLSFGDYTESKTYIGTVRYYTIRTENKVCAIDFLVEKRKVLSKFCYVK